MSNPLLNWKHGKPIVSNKTYLLPLIQEPIYDSELNVWTSRYYFNVPDGGKFPKIQGKLFEWEDSIYRYTTHVYISDQDILRDLEYSKRLDPGKHVFVKVFLEKEEDEYFVMLKGLKHV